MTRLMKTHLRNPIPRFKKGEEVRAKRSGNVGVVLSSRSAMVRVRWTEGDVTAIHRDDLETF